VMKITYLHSDNEWKEYSEFIQNLVKEHTAHKICDVGGGANPVLSLQFVNDNQLDCTALDISSAELEKAPKGYKKLVQDIEAKNFVLPDQFDFIVTKMMAEHIINGRLFHKNIFSMLKLGGVAVHFFPTLYALPFLVNKVTPEWLSSLLLDVFLPRDRYQLGKFSAYYSWCYGPTPSMLAMLTEVGYEILEYRGFFGNTYYKRIPIIRDLHKAYSHYLVQHPNPYLTSFAQVILRKPENTPM
jgi:ubiquinone/menaquinone biosynthesis C-methylase UbiE